VQGQLLPGLQWLSMGLTAESRAQLLSGAAAVSVAELASAAEGAVTKAWTVEASAGDMKLLEHAVLPQASLVAEAHKITTPPVAATVQEDVVDTPTAAAEPVDTAARTVHRFVIAAGFSGAHSCSTRGVCCSKACASWR